MDPNAVANAEFIANYVDPVADDGGCPRCARDLFCPDHDDD